MCQGVYNKTKITFSAIVIDVVMDNPEVLLWINQKAKRISITRPRRYERRSMADRMASIRRPIRRLLQPTARSNPRRRGRCQYATPGSGCLTEASFFF